MDYFDYIIDFERVNELTAHPYDDPEGGAMNMGRYAYPVSRKFIKAYLDEFSKCNMRDFTPNERWLRICKILHYNKVILSPSDIRDKKIEKALS